MAVQPKAPMCKKEEAFLYHVKYVHSFDFILEKEGSKDIHWNEIFHHWLWDVFIFVFAFSCCQSLNLSAAGTSFTVGVDSVP